MRSLQDSFFLAGTFIFACAVCLPSVLPSNADTLVAVPSKFALLQFYGHCIFRHRDFGSLDDVPENYYTSRSSSPRSTVTASSQSLSADLNCVNNNTSDVLFAVQLRNRSVLVGFLPKGSTDYVRVNLFYPPKVGEMLNIFDRSWKVPFDVPKNFAKDDSAWVSDHNVIFNNMVLSGPDYKEFSTDGVPDNAKDKENRLEFVTTLVHNYIDEFKDSDVISSALYRGDGVFWVELNRLNVTSFFFFHRMNSSLQVTPFKNSTKFLKFFVAMPPGFAGDLRRLVNNKELVWDFKNHRHWVYLTILFLNLLVYCFILFIIGVLAFSQRAWRKPCFLCGVLFRKSGRTKDAKDSLTFEGFDPFDDVPVKMLKKLEKKEAEKMQRFSESTAPRLSEFIAKRNVSSGKAQSTNGTSQ